MQSMHDFLGSYPWLLDAILMQVPEPPLGGDESMGCPRVCISLKHSL